MRGNETVVFGRGPNPGIVDKFIDKPEGSGWDDRGQRGIVGVCVHKMLGTLGGTDFHFRNPSVKSLTDFGIGG